MSALLSQVLLLAIGTTPYVSLLTVYRWGIRAAPGVPRSRGPFLRYVGRSVFEAWALLEVMFWFYFRLKKASLENKRAYQPSVLWKAPGERKALLRSLLANSGRIHSGDAAVDRAAPEASVGIRRIASTNTMRRSQAPEFLGGPKGVRSAENIFDFDSRRRRKLAGNMVAMPSVENFLRYQEAAEEGDEPVSRMPSGRLNRMSSVPARSMADLLAAAREDCHDHSMNRSSSRLLADTDEDELSVLKHLEICSWFDERKRRGQRGFCCDPSVIRRGNLEEWVLSYCFDGAESADALLEEERSELRPLVDEVATWAGLRLGPDFEGKNETLHCFRLRIDPMPAVHRPLLVYALTALVMPALGNRTLMGLGFRPYRAGSTEYWLRLPHGVQGTRSGRPVRLEGAGRALVFCHGIGVGPTMCLPLLEFLVKGCGSHPIFLVDSAAVSMRFVEDPPCAREVAANVADMLESWGLQTAHLVGHSFGSFVLAWVLRYKRSYVEKMSFLDPVCFLLLKVLVEGYELQQLRPDHQMDTMEKIVKYFVFTELFVCNYLSRCFFWEESQVTMEDLSGVATLIVLESRDAIVPTHSVQRVVVDEQARRAAQGGRVGGCTPLEVLWVDEQPHAGFLFDPLACREVGERVQSFHNDDAAAATSAGNRPMIKVVPPA